VYVPHASKMQKSSQNYKRVRFDKIRQDPVLTQKPEEMLKGPGFDGGISKPRTTAQYIMRTIYETSENKVDPLEAIKMVQEKAKNNPEFVDHAYRFTDPKRVLDYTSKDSAEMQLMSLFAKCKHCGMKICQCHKQLRPEDEEGLQKKK
jgi:hypothetical protein